jgi:hypothetical protein
MTDRNFNNSLHVQNALTRVVLHAAKFDHTAPALIQMHWLPVKQRVGYKLGSITFNALHINDPVCLRDVLTVYQPSRDLRSCDQQLFAADRTGNCFSVTFCCRKLEQHAA